jgi:hypothetical protein
MTFEDIKPGSWIEVSGLKGQVVWTSSFRILRLGRVTETKELCVFVPEIGKYRVLEVSKVEQDFNDLCSFSRERLGEEGV